MGLQEIRPASGRESLNGCEERGPERHWRDRAMNAALDTEASDGQCEDALLSEIRRRLPGCSTIICWLDRKRLLAYLESECMNCASLLRGSDRFFHWEDKGAVFAYVGWYGVQWRGRKIEVALTPGTGDDDPSLCIAEDPVDLEAFVRAASEYARRPAGRCLRYSSGWAS